MRVFLQSFIVFILFVIYCPLVIPPTTSLFSMVVSVFLTLALSLPKR